MKLAFQQFVVAQYSTVWPDIRRAEKRDRFGELSARTQIIAQAYDAAIHGAFDDYQYDRRGLQFPEPTTVAEMVGILALATRLRRFGMESWEIRAARGLWREYKRVRDVLALDVVRR
jgi:hypothetical protein